MPSTFAHACLPASCMLMTVRSFPKLTKGQIFKLLIATMIIANAPDIDIIPASMAPNQWREIHRNWGHNIFALSFLICLGKWFIKKFVSDDITHLKAWVISGALVLSHVLLDGMQGVSNDGLLHGVPLFWPISNSLSWHFTLPLRLFTVVKLDPSRHFLIGHITSMHFWRTVIFVEFYNCAVLFVLWFFSTRLFYKVVDLRNAKKIFSQTLRRAV